MNIWHEIIFYFLCLERLISTLRKGYAFFVLDFTLKYIKLDEESLHKAKSTYKVLSAELIAYVVMNVFLLRIT